MELRRYVPLILLILFVWTTITVIFVVIDSIIVPWRPPQETFWTVVNFFTFPFSFDQGQLGFWSLVRNMIQIIFSGLLVLLWLYLWYKMSKKLFWIEMKKEKLS
ncbi:MAG: hypothetical protein QW279_04945 [Candidatus Jordarchaeaceae archaeon]